MVEEHVFTIKIHEAQEECFHEQKSNCRIYLKIENIIIIGD